MNFNILQYPVDNALESTLIKSHREYLNWPLVYFLEEKKERGLCWRNNRRFNTIKSTFEIGKEAKPEFC